MRHEGEEKELRRLFREWRQAEGLQAPPFERSWAQAQAGRRRAADPWRPLCWAAGGALLAALSLVAVFNPRVPYTAGPTAAVSVSQWRSPTDFLLQSPGDPLLRSLPRLGASLEGTTTLMPKEIDGGSR